MNMKRLVSLIALLTAASASAQNTEIVAIANSDEKDGTFSMLSVRQALTNTLDEGWFIRLVTSQSDFPVSSSDAVIQTDRFIVGYGMQVDEFTNVRFSLGSVSRERSASPVTTFYPDGEDSGTFAAVEGVVENEEGKIIGILEFDGAAESTYTSAEYIEKFAGFNLGVTGNYIDEDDFSREALGLRADFTRNNTTFSVIAAYAESVTTGNEPKDASYVELLVVTSF